MPIKIPAAYESWDLRKPLVPPSSRLYHLSPIGAGTTFMESLTSFIIRLAEAHSVSTDTLFTREILPIVTNRSSRSIRRALTPSFRIRAKAMNGTGIMASNWVLGLEKSTLRKDLRFLTLLSWANVLSQKYLFRSARAWCPLCYGHWLKTEQTVYDPLLWSLEVVRICPQHLQPLLSRCIWCNNTLPLLDRRSRSGRCSKCGEWLGSASGAVFPHKKPINPEELNWQLWVTNSVGDLIAAAPLLKSLPSEEKLSKTISDCIDKFAGGILSRFASMIQKKKTTVWGWQKGKTKIPLPDLLRICYCLKTSPVDFLTKEFSIDLQSDSVRKLVSVPQKAAQHRRKFDSNKIRHELKKALDGEHPPPSLQAVASRLKYDRRFLFKHFPDLCRAISASYGEYQKVIREQMRKQCGEEVRQVALNLYIRGIYPSRRRVAVLLTRPADIERKEAYEVLSKVRHELGLNQYQYDTRKRLSKVCQMSYMNRGI
jgi:hypothetical protein